MESFSTRGLPARRKVAFWNTINSQSFAAMDIAPRHAPSFDGELRREPIGPLTFLDVQSAAVRIRHTRSHILRHSAPSYLLVTPLRGSFELRLAGRPGLDLAAGEYCLLDHGEPYELAHGDDVRTLCLDIPRGILASVLSRPDDAVGRVMRGRPGREPLLPVLLREIGATEARPDRPRPGTALAQGLLGFLAAAYAAELDLPLSATDARRQALLDRIETRLHDQGLNPAGIARETGISPRRLRALLASGGESFSEYVLRRRLERCAALLGDAHWRDRSITEIAFRNGFNNMTHFGYAFKKRFGLTPSRHRAMIAG